MSKKLSKTALKFNHYWKVFRKHEKASLWCFRNYIYIMPDCVIDRQKWRIEIEVHDKNGNLLEYKASDDGKDKKYYTTKYDVDLKCMELRIFYHESSLKDS